jgi:hypothetical protein
MRELEPVIRQRFEVEDETVELKDGGDEEGGGDEKESDGEEGGDGDED